MHTGPECQNPWKMDLKLAARTVEYEIYTTDKVKHLAGGSLEVKLFQQVTVHNKDVDYLQQSGHDFCKKT